MFGSSGTPGKEDESVIDPSSHSEAPKPTKIAIPNDINNGGEKRVGLSPERKSPEDAAALEKKRRSSGVSKARDIFSSAKQSLHLYGASPTSGGSADKGLQSPLAKFGKTDPALSVPQGALNNSAGESAPTPRSTFRVGVTEDKNKKCRRTMEDTHAYLYNFLSTPAPAIGADTASKGDSASNVSDNPGQSVVETDNGYFAIFDGHAGTFAADWCGKKLHLLLEENIRKNPNKPIPELLDQTFTSVDQQLEKLPLKNSGCTAVIAVLRWEDRIPTSQSATGSAAIAPAAAAAVKAASESHSEKPTDSEAHILSQVSANATDAAPALADGRPESVTEALPKLREAAERQRVLYTANVGDARIVLCRNGRALRLSYDHKGSDEMEGKRVAHAGGLILNNRVNGVLAVTRALGDAYMKDLVTGHPYTTETIIQPDQDEFLILACDGLWDVCSDQEAIDLIRHTHDPQVASKQLVDYALARFSTDNLSIMVVRFDNKAFKERLQEGSVGVDKDRASSKGGISEADAIVSQAKKHIGETGGLSDKSIAKIIQEEEEAEPGPELNPNAARAAMKNPPN